MSILTINLLPPEEKKAVEFEEARKIIRFFASAASLVLGAGVLMLLPSYMPLFFEQRTLEYTLAVEEESWERLKSGELINDAAKDKTLVRSLKESLTKPARASLLLSELLESQENIRITEFGITKEGIVRIGGFAKKRADLLEFEKILRDSGRFQEFSFPLSSIVKESDITFTMQAKLADAEGL